LVGDVGVCLHHNRMQAEIGFMLPRSPLSGRHWKSVGGDLTAGRDLERARAGEQIEITDRGRPIAMLVPFRVTSGGRRADRCWPAAARGTNLAAWRKAGQRSGGGAAAQRVPRGDARRADVNSSVIVYCDSSALVKLVVEEPESVEREAWLGSARLGSARRPNRC